MKDIDEVRIKKIIEVIESSRFSKVPLADLSISDEDIKEFKKFIDIEAQRTRTSGIDHSNPDNLYTFPGEYADFSFYKSVANSLFNISEENIDNAFCRLMEIGALQLTGDE